MVDTKEIYDTLVAIVSSAPFGFAVFCLFFFLFFLSLMMNYTSLTLIVFFGMVVTILRGLGKI